MRLTPEQSAELQHAILAGLKRDFKALLGDQPFLFLVQEYAPLLNFLRRRFPRALEVWQEKTKRGGVVWKICKTEFYRQPGATCWVAAFTVFFQAHRGRGKNSTTLRIVLSPEPVRMRFDKLQTMLDYL